MFRPKKEPKKPKQQVVTMRGLRLENGDKIQDHIDNLISLAEVYNKDHTVSPSEVRVEIEYEYSDPLYCNLYCEVPESEYSWNYRMKDYEDKKAKHDTWMSQHAKEIEEYETNKKEAEKKRREDEEEKKLARLRKQVATIEKKLKKE